MRLTVLVALALVALPAHAVPRPAAAPSPGGEGLRTFLVAREALENSRGADARCLLLRAIAAEPDLAIAHAYLALLSDEDGRAREIELATSLAARLPELERKEIEARVAALQGEHERSLALLTELAAARPGDAHAQYELGERLLSLGQHAKAEPLLLRATALDPRYSPYWNFLGYALLGQRKLDAAIEALERYVALSGGHGNAHDSLGEALLEAGRLPEAEASFRRAVARDGDESVSWAALSQTLYLQGKQLEAYAILETARGRICLEKQVPLDIQEVGLRVADGDGEGALARLELLASRTGNVPELAEHLELDRAQVLLALGRPAVALGVLEAVPMPSLDNLLDAPEARRAALHAQAWAALGGPDVWQKDLGIVGMSLSRTPSDAYLEGTLAYITGAQMLAAGDPDAAARAMSETRRDQWYFQVLYADALEQAGRVPGAREVREDLVASLRRAPFYLAARRHALERLSAP